MARVCIICQEEVGKGEKVADDIVIRGIRRFKEMTKTVKNNELVVCESDMGTYRKKRQGYERNLAVYLVIAGLVFVLLVFVPIFTTGFSIYSVLIGLLLAGLLVVLPVMTSHTPALVSMGKIAPVAVKERKEKKEGKATKAKSRKK